MAAVEAYERSVMDALRRAGEPVREVVLYERVRGEHPDLGAEEFLAVVERLATLGHLRTAVERELPAHDPAPFAPRFHSVVE